MAVYTLGRSVANYENIKLAGIMLESILAASPVGKLGRSSMLLDLAQYSNNIENAPADLIHELRIIVHGYSHECPASKKMAAARACDMLDDLDCKSGRLPVFMPFPYTYKTTKFDHVACSGC